jgi:hypothetical protein
LDPEGGDMRSSACDLGDPNHVLLGTSHREYSQTPYGSGFFTERRGYPLGSGLRRILLARNLRRTPEWDRIAQFSSANATLVLQIHG